jgi:hypothetical protein
MSMLELSRYLFLIGALPFIVFGLLHAAATPQTPAHAKGLSPRDPAVRDAMGARSCPYLCVEGLRRERKRGKLLETFSTQMTSPAREARSFPHGRECRLCAG